MIFARHSIKAMAVLQIIEFTQVRAFWGDWHGAPSNELQNLAY